MPDLDALLRFAHELLDETDAIASELFRGELTITAKHDRTLVTQADTGVERHLRERISAAYPTHGILGEEFGTEPGDGEMRCRTLAITMGAMAAALPAQVRNDRQRDTLLAAKQAELQLAATRLQIARSELENVRRRADVGLVGRESLAAAEAELQRMTSQLSRVRLDLQEIRASAKAPRDDLPAPLVDGQDFVRARLEQALRAAQKQLSAAETETAEVKRRALVGAAPHLRLLEAQAELARQQAEMQRVAGEIELRKRRLQPFLRSSSRVSAQSVTLALTHLAGTG